MQLSDKIAYLRKKHSMSQEQLADKLDISRQAIYKWEAGMSIPELEKIKRLAEIFEVSFDDLLNDELNLQEEKSPTPAPQNEPKEVVADENKPEENTANKNDEKNIDDKNINIDVNVNNDVTTVSKMSLKKILIIILSITLAVAVLSVGIFFLVKNLNEENPDDDDNNGQNNNGTGIHTHAYSDWALIKMPSCTELGSEKKVCSLCNHEVTRDIAKIEHTEVVVPGYEPTCTLVGMTDGKKCSVCNEVLEEGQPLATNSENHTQGVLKGYASTCQTEGKTDGIECTSCHEIIVAQASIPKANCTYIKVEGKAPTCTEAGLTDGQKCSVCQDVLEEQKPIDKLGHTEQTINGTSPSCTKTGLTDGKQCSVCGTITVAQETIKLLPHTEQVVAGKEATCKEAGLTDGSVCSVCDKVLTEQIEIPKSNVHTPVVVKGTEATCTKTGLTDGKQCSVCGVFTVPQETIKLLPHTEQVVTGKEATCKETGLTNGSVCSVCDTVITEQTVIPKSDVHTPEAVKGKEATCKETGLTDGSVCSVCDKVLTEQIEIPKSNVHTPVTVKGKEATCLATGLSDGEKCSVCDKILSAQIILPMLEHTPENVSAVNATCTSKGHTSGTKCSACQSVLSGMNEIAQALHRYINEKCYYCNDEFYSDGLVYELKSDGTYKVTGRGDCRDVHLVFPMSYEGKAVTEIDFSPSSNWSEAPIISISIPDTVTTVTGFVPSSVTSLTIGQNVQALDLSGCSKLIEVYNFSSIDLSSIDTIKVINTDASVDSIIDFTSYAPYVFYTLDGVNYLTNYYAKNTELTLPESYYGQKYAIGDYAFYATGAISVSIPRAVTAIGTGAFSWLSTLSSVEFEEGGLLTVGDGAFSNCTNLTQITLPESVTAIGNNSFEYTALEAFVVGKNVTSIGNVAFQQSCAKLKSLYIPKSVKTIGIYIIDGAATGITVYCEASSQPSGWDSSWRGGMVFDLTVLWGQTMPNEHVYENGVCKKCLVGEEYSHGLHFMLSDDLSSFILTGIGSCTDTQIKVPPKYLGLPVTKVGENAFENNTQITSITIPDSVTSIGSLAFSGCTSLEAAYFPNTITRIEEGTFYDCKSLEEFTIPDSVTYIGAGAFCQAGPKVLVIGRNVTEIGQAAFADCYIEKIYIPNSVVTTGFDLVAKEYVFVSTTVYCEASSWPSGWLWPGTGGNYLTVKFGQTMPY